jgi:hypothetical protein
MRVEQERERQQTIEKENIQLVQNGPRVHLSKKYSHVQSRLRQKEIDQCVK